MLCGIYPAAIMEKASPDEPPVHAKRGMVGRVGVEPTAR